MALANTSSRFGSVAKTLHWLTALLIITAIPLGLVAVRGDISSADGIARTAWLFSLHKTVGVTAFFVALIRIIWAFTQARPAHLHPDRKLETFAAEAVHWLLYLSLVLVPLSGWFHHAAATGYAPILWPFGQTLPFIPQSESLAHLFEGWHFVLTKVLALSLFLHIAGAIKHHVIDKDATLRRMLPGRSDVPEPTISEHTKTPFFTALVIYALALGGGTYLGLQHESVQAEALEAVESDWTVESGTLGISVDQLGSAVSGSFADWTADIKFDPESETGSVTVVISIGSLTLGSVTKDALGGDYLDATNSPQATFNADISRTDQGLVADGTLTIRETALPLQLPFTLDITDGLASMTAETSLNRIDYGVGATAQPTEGSLGFNVAITVELTARAPE